MTMETLVLQALVVGAVVAFVMVAIVAIAVKVIRSSFKKEKSTPAVPVVPVVKEEKIEREEEQKEKEEKIEASLKTEKDEEELVKKVEQMYVDQRFKNGRISGYVKDHKIVELYFLTRSYKTAKDLKMAEKLTEFEMERLDSLVSLLATFRQEQVERLPEAKVINIKQEGIGDIYIYEHGQNIVLGSKRRGVARIERSKESGRLHIALVRFAKEDFEDVDEVIESYQLIDEKGEQDVRRYNIFQNAINDGYTAKYWAEEISRIESLEIQLDHYNKYRHRLFTNPLGQLEFISEEEAILRKRYPDPKYVIQTEPEVVVEEKKVEEKKPEPKLEEKKPETSESRAIKNFTELHKLMEDKNMTVNDLLTFMSSKEESEEAAASKEE